MRWSNKLLARMGGFFWLPCDNCGEHFGGHEQGWKARDVSTPGDSLLCPRCAAASESEGRA